MGANQSKTTSVQASGAGSAAASTMEHCTTNNYFSQAAPTVEKNEELYESLRQKLRTQYKNMKIPPLPWFEKKSVAPLDDLYVDLEMHTRDARGREQTDANVALQDVFEDWNRQFSNGEKSGPKIKVDPVAVLLEGGPGFGKSTLTRKLAQDWARGEAYMANFDLAIVFQLRHFRGALTSILSCSLKLDNRSEADIFHELQKRKTLFILDGYDELADEQVKIIEPLFDRTTLSNISLVVTSRPGHLNSDRKEETKESEVPELFEPRLIDCFDKRIVIRGISVEFQNDFLAKYLETFDPKKKGVLMAKLDSLQLSDDDILKCPLILIILVLLAQECDDVQNIRTKTDVYKHLFNFIIQRGLTKLRNTDSGVLSNSKDKKKQDAKVDLFQERVCDKKEEWPFYMNLVDKFGELAFAAIRSTKTHFTESEISSHFNKDETILVMDFLILNESVNGFLQCTWYEPIHRTFLEFAAAYHLWLSHRHQLKEKLIFLDRNYSLFVKPSYPMISFLSGILGNQIHLLPKALPDLQNVWFNKYQFLLAEMPINTELLVELDRFIPEWWDVPFEIVCELFFYETELHREVVSRGMGSRKISTISWHLTTKANFSFPVELEHLVLTVERNVAPAAHVSGEVLPCSRLSCFVHVLDEPSDAYTKFADILTKINCVNVTFDFSDALTCRAWLPLLYEDMTANKRFTFVRLKRLDCRLPFVEQYVKTKILRELDLLFCSSGSYEIFDPELWNYYFAGVMYCH